jgi:hypothetical protein
LTSISSASTAVKKDPEFDFLVFQGGSHGGMHEMRCGNEG